MKQSSKKEEDISWQSYYDIERAIRHHNDGDIGSYYDNQYYIIDFSTKERIYGPYRDFTYAKKQARRRYKKLVRNMERALMS